jgi:hypothetical protein
VSTAAAPTVGIVVLNWNGWPNLRECLGLLRQLDYGSFRIVVVDNGSDDDSAARLGVWVQDPTSAANGKPLHLIEYSEAEAARGGIPEHETRLAELPPPDAVVLIRLPHNRGFAAGNNVGLRYLLARRIPYALLLNNDVAVEPGLLRELVGCLEERPDCAGVAPKILHHDDHSRILFAGGRLKLWQARAIHLGRFASDGPRWRGVHLTEHLTGCCALFRSEFLAQAGLLDEDFFFGQEDVALSCTARRLGWRLAVQLDARVYHGESSSLANRASLAVYYYNKYRLLLLRKHGSAAERLVGFAFLGASRLAKFPLAALRGRGAMVRAELCAYRDFVAGRLADWDRDRAQRRQ